MASFASHALSISESSITASSNVIVSSAVVEPILQTVPSAKSLFASRSSAVSTMIEPYCGVKRSSIEAAFSIPTPVADAGIVSRAQPTLLPRAILLTASAIPPA